MFGQVSCSKCPALFWQYVPKLGTELEKIEIQLLNSPFLSKVVS
jgi:hypothetical protein